MAKPMTLEQAWLYYDNEWSNDKRWKRLKRIALSGSLLILSGAVLLFHPATILAGMICVHLGLPVMCIPVFIAFQHQRRGWGFWDALEKQEPLLPRHKLRNAESLFKWPESILAAWECEECHIPGDCPLCGAT